MKKQKIKYIVLKARCKYCGRPLKVDKSVYRQSGDACEKKFHGRMLPLSHYSFD